VRPGHIADIPRKRIATYTPGPVRSVYRTSQRTPATGEAISSEEVDSMTNTSTWHLARPCGLGLSTAAPVAVAYAQRTRMPVTTGEVSLLVDRAPIAGVAAAAKDAFGFPAPPWGPPR
jgi:hypothetical protein